MEGTEQIHDQEIMGLNQNGKNVKWVLMENEDHGGFKPGFIDTDSDGFVEELGSESPSSSSDMVEEDNSSTTSSSSSSSSLSPASSSYGPLFQLSELMSQLPIKRGLSKFYHGKSDSFASLSSVKSLEDLAKKGRPCSGYSERMKACKSYGGLSLGHVDNHHHNQRSISPKATITKKKPTNYRISSTTFGSSKGFSYGIKSLDHPGE